MSAVIYPDNNDYIVSRTTDQTITGQKIFQAGAATSVPLRVRGATGQTANLTEWRDAADALMAFINPGGAFVGTNLTINGANNSGIHNLAANNRALTVGPDTGIYSKLHVTTQDAGQAVVSMKTAASQSANIMTVVNNAGVELARINSLGRFMSDTYYTTRGGGVSYFTSQDGQPGLNVKANIASQPAAIFSGTAAQSAGIVQIKDNAGTNLMTITNGGHIYAGEANGQGPLAIGVGQWGSEVKWTGNGFAHYTLRNYSGNLELINSSSAVTLGTNGALLARWGAGGAQTHLLPDNSVATGTSLTGIRIIPMSATPDWFTGIAWEAAGNVTGGANGLAGGSHAAIMVRSSGSYGTKMYFNTTDSYAAGAKESLVIDHVGNAYLMRGTLTQYSSVEGKKNITPISNHYSIAQLKNITPIRYQRNDDESGRWFLSYSAEEVASVAPEAAGYDENGVIVGVDVNAMSTLTMVAVQELIDRVEALEAALVAK